MGKGDRKTKKGKITIGSYGVRRPKKKSTIVPAATTKKTTATKAPKAKKPAAKKPKAKKEEKAKDKETAE